MKKDISITTGDAKGVIIAHYKKLRDEYENKIYAHMNECSPCGSKLIDCGAAGVCVVRWTRMKWTCEWFDGVEELP